MANDTPITVIGNITSDPELRFTPTGHAVASFTVASTPRHFDKASNEWVDDEALFLRASIWRDQAEHIVESLTKGMRVIAVGRLVQRSFETKEGEKRTVIEMQCDEVGPSMKYATAKVNRIVRNAQAGPAGADDPWASPPASNSWDSQPRQPMQPTRPPAQQGAFAGAGMPADDAPPFLHRTPPLTF